MTHPVFHANTSVKKWGGVVDDYLPIHEWGRSEQEIARMSPKETFIEYCEWNGLLSWGGDALESDVDLVWKRGSSNAGTRFP